MNNFLMNVVRHGCLTLALAALSPGIHAQQDQVHVSTGLLQGYSESGIHVFKGIPYGAPTGGAQRFKLAEPAAPWNGVRDAQSYGPECPQMLISGGSGNSTAPSSEDCLLLNVWTPGLNDGARRPVMVWLHGGGFSAGSGSSPINDGVRLAQRGDVVMVSLNHRLNFFGYLYLADFDNAEFADSGNLGQLDIVLALQWIRRNIAVFGGDPGNVTLFGESGGGSKVATLLATREAEGLFHKAILQSGFGLTAILPEDAALMRDKLFRELGLSHGDIAGLQGKSVQDIQQAMFVVTGGSPYGVGPVLDGRSVPRHPFTPDAPRRVRDIPVILGSNKDETTALFAPPGSFDLDWPGLEQLLLGSFAKHVDVPELIVQLRHLRPQATPSDLFFAVTTELGMGNNARTFAVRKSAQQAPVYLYRMEWETPVNGGRMRAHHGLDLPLMFDNVANGASMVGDGAAEAQQVAEAMSSAWVQFARTGNPNAPGLAYWPAFTPSGQETMVFDVVSRAVNDPIRSVRLLLENPPEKAVGTER
jgi:para-nitrobenzyl esterase